MNEQDIVSTVPDAVQLVEVITTEPDQPTEKVEPAKTDINQWVKERARYYGGTFIGIR